MGSSERAAPVQNMSAPPRATIAVQTLGERGDDTAYSPRTGMRRVARASLEALIERALLESNPCAWVAPEGGAEHLLRGAVALARLADGNLTKSFGRELESLAAVSVERLADELSARLQRIGPPPTCLPAMAMVERRGADLLPVGFDLADSRAAPELPRLAAEALAVLSRISGNTFVRAAVPSLGCEPPTGTILLWVIHGH